jgi:hypothetical protein
LTDTTLTPEEAVANLEAACANTPNHVRDLAEELLGSGKVTAETTIADLGKVIRERYAIKQ